MAAYGSTKVSIHRKLSWKFTPAQPAFPHSPHSGKQPAAISDTDTRRSTGRDRT